MTNIGIVASIISWHCHNVCTIHDKHTKLMVDFKFDAIQLSLHKEPPEVGLVKKLTVSLYCWVEQCVPTLHLEMLPHSLIIGRAKRAPHWGVQSRFRVIHICRSVGRSVCHVQKMRRQNYVAQKRACSMSD